MSFRTFTTTGFFPALGGGPSEVFTWSHGLVKNFKIYFCIFLLKELPSSNCINVPENLDFSLITALYICIPLEEVPKMQSYIFFSFDSYRNPGSQR